MAIVKISDIYRGDSKLYKIVLPDFDLSLDTFLLAVKNNASDDDIDAVYQVEKAPLHDIAHDTLKIDDPTNGIIYIRVPAADNAKLTPGNKYWLGIQWVRVVSGVSHPKTLHVQQFKCLQDINIGITKAV